MMMTNIDADKIALEVILLNFATLGAPSDNAGCYSIQCSTHQVGTFLTVESVE